MPSSDLNYVVDVLAAVAAAEPQSILEIGPGFGKYGVLLREMLDLKPGTEGGYAPFSRTIDAIEVERRYLTPIHQYIYNEVHIGDAAAVIRTLGRKYDLVLMVDVIEHFEKLAAFELLVEALKIAPNVVIATPYGYYPQGEEFDNPREAHLSGWFPSEFRDGGASYLWRKGLAIIALFTKRNVALPPASQLPDGPLSAGDLRNLVLMAEMYRRTGQWVALADAGRRALAIQPTNEQFRAWITEAMGRLSAP
jgi:hypothetical protein